MNKENYKEEIRIEAGVKYLVKITYHPEMDGTQVYSNWDLKHNICWFNVQGIIVSYIYGLITFAWLTPKRWYLFKPSKLWLTPIYAEGYNTAEWEEYKE